MENYVCKIATLDEIIKRMDYLIEIHPNNNIWVVAKENAVRGYNEGSKIMYIGLLNDEIICEATAYINESAFVGDIKETANLLSDDRAYLSAFRTNKEHQGKGYFSVLYKYMENDLKKRNYIELSLYDGIKGLYKFLKDLYTFIHEMFVYLQVNYMNK